MAGAIGAGEITEKPGGGFTPAENAQALGLQYRGLLARLGQLKGSNNPALAEEIARTENHLEMVKQKLLELGQAAQKSGQQLAKPAEGFGYNPASVFAYRGVSGTSATPYDELFHQFEEQYKLPQALLRAIAKQESDFNVAAVSAKGAQGLMQFMPGTARQYGVANPMDAKQAIEGAAKLMADLLKQFGGDVVKALAAYNAGPGKVTVAGGNLAMLPAETQKYVPSVMKNVAEWGNLRVDVDTALRDQKSLLDALSEQRKSAIELDNEAAQDGFKRQEAELKASLDEQALTQDEYYLRLSGLRNLSIDAEIAARRKLIEMTREEAAGQDEAENLRAKTEVAKLLQEITALEARRGEVMDEAITKAIQKENELNQERKERVAGILEQTPQGKAQAQLTEEAQWYEDAQKAGVSAGQWRQGLQVIQQKYGAGANQPDFATQMATSLQANADNLVNGLSSAVANFLFNATDAINRKIQDLQAQMTANAAMGEYQNTVAGRVMLAQNIQSLESQPTMDPTRRAALIQSAQTAQSRAEAVALQNAQQAQQLANQTAFQNSLAGQMLTLFENMGKSLFQDFLSIGLKDLFKQGNTPLNPMYVSIVGMGIPGLGGNGTGLLQLSGFGNASDAGLGSLANTAAQASGQLQNLGANANTAGTGLIGMLQGIGSSIGNFFSQFFSSSGSGGGGALGGILRGLGSLFGGGSAAAAAASSGTAAADLALALFHSGGIVGYSNPVMRAAPPTVMAGAQRWHSGGFPGLFANEVPAILQKGEEVLTANNPRHARNGAGSGSPANIRIINSIDPELARDFLESSRGEQVLHNFISRNAGAIKQTLASQ